MITDYFIETKLCKLENDSFFVIPATNFIIMITFEHTLSVDNIRDLIV